MSQNGGLFLEVISSKIKTRKISKTANLIIILIKKRAKTDIKPF